MTESDPQTSTQPPGEQPAAAPAAAPAPPADAGAEIAPVAEAAPAVQDGGILIAKATKVATAAHAPRPARAGSRAAKPSDLAAALAARISSQGFSIAEAAGLIGVGAPSLNAVLAGKSTPNARTIGRYAAWAGVSVPAPATAAAKAAPPAATARRGRLGRKPAEAKAVSVKAAFARIRAALAASPAAPADDGIASDKLARAVHQAPEAARRVITALLKAL